MCQGLLEKERLLNFNDLGLLDLLYHPTLRPIANFDVVALGITSNLDAISERGQGSVGPATSAILGNMLVERLRQVALSINVTPVEGVGELVGTDVGVRESRHEIAVDSIFADLDFAEVLGGGDGEEYAARCPSLVDGCQRDGRLVCGHGDGGG